MSVELEEPSSSLRLSSEELCKSLSSLISDGVSDESVSLSEDEADADSDWEEKSDS